MRTRGSRVVCFDIDPIDYVHYIVGYRYKDMDMVAVAEAAENKGRHRRSVGTRAAKTMISKYADKRGSIDASRLASGLTMNMSQLAQTAGLATTTLIKRERSKGRRAQARLREMLEILDRIDDWAGGETLALAWYRSQPIPALNGRTAEALVQSGEAAAVRRYLDHLALGGFA